MTIIKEPVRQLGERLKIAMRGFAMLSEDRKTTPAQFAAAINAAQKSQTPVEPDEVQSWIDGLQAPTLTTILTIGALLNKEPAHIGHLAYGEDWTIYSLTEEDYGRVYGGYIAE